MALSLTLTLFLLLTLAQPCAHVLSVSLWLFGSLLLSGSLLWLTLVFFPADSSSLSLAWLATSLLRSHSLSSPDSVNIVVLLVIQSSVCSDMRFVQNFTLLEIQAKTFTPSISPQFSKSHLWVCFLQSDTSTMLFFLCQVCFKACCSNHVLGETSWSANHPHQPITYLHIHITDRPHLFIGHAKFRSISGWWGHAGACKLW